MDEPAEILEVQPAPPESKRAGSPLLSSAVAATMALAVLYLLLGATLTVIGVIVSREVNAVTDPLPASAWFLNIPLPLGLAGLADYFKTAGMMMGMFICMLGGLVALCSIPYFMAGNGLVKREGWARWWTIFLAAFTLVFALLGLVNILYQSPSLPPEDTLSSTQTWIVVILYLIHACYGVFMLGALLAGKHLQEFSKPVRVLVIERKPSLLVEE